MLKLPDGTIKVLVEGSQRARISDVQKSDDGFFTAAAEIVSIDDGHDEVEMEVLVRSVTKLFEQYVKLKEKLAPEILTSLSGIEDPSRLADTVAAHLSLKIDEKQKICLLYTSPSPRDGLLSRMPSSA